jgi:hypothetical protein
MRDPYICVAHPTGRPGHRLPVARTRLLRRCRGQPVSADQQAGADGTPQDGEKVIIMISLPEGTTAQVRIKSADEPPERESRPWTTPLAYKPRHDIRAGEQTVWAAPAAGAADRAGHAARKPDNPRATRLRAPDHAGHVGLPIRNSPMAGLRHTRT